MRENEECDIPLDMLIFGCESVHVLGPGRSPGMFDTIPSLLDVVINPFLKISLLVTGE